MLFFIFMRFARWMVMIIMIVLEGSLEFLAGSLEIFLEEFSGLFPDACLSVAQALARLLVRGRGGIQLDPFFFSHQLFEPGQGLLQHGGIRPCLIGLFRVDLFAGFLFDNLVELLEYFSHPANLLEELSRVELLFKQQIEDRLQV